LSEATAVVHDYSGLRRAIAARRRALGWTQLEVDYRSGLQDGYTGKLEAGVKNLGDLSLSLMLETLSLEIVIRPRGPRQ
jgi:hypothetical protein